MAAAYVHRFLKPIKMEITIFVCKNVQNVTVYVFISFSKIYIFCKLLEIGPFRFSKCGRESCPVFSHKREDWEMWCAKKDDYRRITI